jgi:hypothetical protein
MIINMVHDWDKYADTCKGKFERAQKRVAVASIGEVSDNDLKVMREMAVSFDAYTRLTSAARQVLLGDADAITLHSLRNEGKALTALTHLCAALLMRETDKIILEILTTALMKISMRMEELTSDT